MSVGIFASCNSDIAAGHFGSDDSNNSKYWEPVSVTWLSIAPIRNFIHGEGGAFTRLLQLQVLADSNH